MNKLLVGILFFLSALMISELTPIVDWLFNPASLDIPHYIQDYLFPIPSALCLFFLAKKWPRPIQVASFAYLVFCSWNLIKELIRLISGWRLNEFFSPLDFAAVVFGCWLLYWYSKRLERKEMERLAGFIM